MKKAAPHAIHEISSVPQTRPLIQIHLGESERKDTVLGVCGIICIVQRPFLHVTQMQTRSLQRTLYSEDSTAQAANRPPHAICSDSARPSEEKSIESLDWFHYLKLWATMGLNSTAIIASHVNPQGPGLGA